MVTTNTSERPATDFDKDQALGEWLTRLSGLIESVDGWARELGWSTRSTRKKMEDSQLGRYQAPALIMQEGTTRIILEPIARSAPGAEGVVDLYLMPAYDDIASLYLCDGGWKVLYPFPGTPVVAAIEERTPLPLSRETLKAVLDELSKDAS